MAGAIDKAGFIREGLFRYAEARETVNYFQTCVYEALMSAFEAKADWKHFHPVRNKDGFESGKAPGAVFLHAYIAGHVPSRHIKEKAWLSLGLYWNARFRPKSVVAATLCWLDGGGPVMPFIAPASGGGIYLAPLYKKSEQRLILDAGPDFNPDIYFVELLDAADEALGPFDGDTQPVNS